MNKKTIKNIEITIGSIIGYIFIAIGFTLTILIIDALFFEK